MLTRLAAAVALKLPAARPRSSHTSPLQRLLLCCTRHPIRCRHLRHTCRLLSAGIGGVGGSYGGAAVASGLAALEKAGW